MNKYFGLFAALVLVCLSPIKAFAEIDVSAKSAIVIDAASKRVLFEKDIYTKRPMASTTKIMTALLAIENNELDKIITVSPSAANTEGSSVWLSPGEHMSVEDLLYSIMLSSGNDAAAALAEATAGNTEAFAVLMNERAHKIGAMNTHFTNPHGLPDDDHYTTAFDLALITSEAMKNDLFRKICSTEYKSISWENSQWNRSLTNHNKLLKMYEYAIGVKTGYTKKAGRCLVSAAEKNGQMLIAVTLSAPDDWNDHIKLLDYCFNKYRCFTVCSANEEVSEQLSQDDKRCEVKPLYKDDFTISLADGEEDYVKTENVIYDVDCPIRKGQVIGVCNVYLFDKQIGTIDIISASDVFKKETFGSILIKLWKGLVVQ